MRLRPHALRRAFSAGTSAPRLHELSTSQIPKYPATILSALLVDAGFKLFEVADIAVTQYACSSDSVSPFVRCQPERGASMLDELPCTHGISIDLPCCDSGADELKSVIGIIEKAAERSIPTRVTLLDALARDDPHNVQYVASELARAGADLVVLASADGDAECDNLESTTAEVLTADVPGAPMSDRLGLRVSCGDDDGVVLYRRALDMCVQHLDTCLLDGPTTAPNPIAVASLLEERHLKHGIHVDMLKHGPVTFKIADLEAGEEMTEEVAINAMDVKEYNKLC